MAFTTYINTQLFLRVSLLINLIALVIPVVYENSPVFGYIELMYLDSVSWLVFIILIGGIGLNYYAMKLNNKENIPVFSYSIISSIIIILVTMVVNLYVISLNGGTVNYLADEIARTGPGLIVTRVAVTLLLIGGFLSRSDEPFNETPEEIIEDTIDM